MAAQDRSIGGDGRWALLGAALIGAAAAAVDLRATREGVYVSPDGVSYLRAADGLALLEHPSGHFPPVYPLVLRVLQALGLGSLGSARAAGAGLALVNPILGALVVRRRAPAGWAVAVAAALAVATPLAVQAAGVLSEPLFVAVLLVWFLAIGSSHRHAVVAAGLVAALAVGTRWIGLCLVPAGLLVLAPDRRRCLRYLGAALGPVVAWYAAQAALGSLPVRALAWHPPSRSKLEGGLSSLVAWVTGDRGSPVAGVAVLIGATVLLVRASWGTRDRSLAAVAGCYAATLLATTLLLDDQTPIDDRLLAPLLVVVLLALPAIERLPLRPLLLAAVAASLTVTAAHTRRVLDPLDRSMGGLGDDATVVAARGLGDGRVVSNAPGALWLLADVEAAWLPRVYDPYTADERPEAPDELAALAATLGPGDHLVWLRYYDYRDYLPTEAEAVAALDLVPVAELGDGAIYERAP